MPRTMTPAMRKAMFARIAAMKQQGPFKAAVHAQYRAQGSAFAHGIGGAAVGGAIGAAVGKFADWKTGAKSNDGVRTMSALGAGVGGYIGSVVGGIKSSRKSARLGRIAFGRGTANQRRFNWTRHAGLPGYAAARVVEKL